MQMVAVPYTGPTPRLMAFIDGENLVARYQAMRERGKQPQAGTQHAPDEYVWNPGFHLPGRFEVIRAHHYASVVETPPRSLTSEAASSRCASAQTTSRRIRPPCTRMSSRNRRSLKRPARSTFKWLWTRFRTRTSEPQTRFYWLLVMGILSPSQRK